MKTLKHLIIVLFSLALAAVLAACGNSQKAVDPQSIDLASLPASIDVNLASSLHQREDVLFLDVREPDEYNAGHIPNVVLIPMGEVPSRLSEIPTDTTVIVTCRSGNRSGQVTSFLRENGYNNVHNMEGGILAWESAGFDVEK
ncbi:MAG TPA: rhodanese-like domain-containing protein [Anaerolineales bacterium]|nr:rhodanese-like domain-containing protein [Anaerolineales bacterium]